MAALSLWLSAMPRFAAVALALLALAFSAWRIHRDRQAAPASLRIADDGSWVVLLRPQARPVLLVTADIGVREPLAWVRAGEPGGRTLGWLWLADGSDPEGMRKLRLACAGRKAKSAPSLATMAS